MCAHFYISFKLTGKVIIVGNDPESAQRARTLLELFEDSSPLAEDEYNQMASDYSSLGMDISYHVSMIFKL